MSGSHGCAGRWRRARLGTALAASGLFFAVAAPGPARACHIQNDHNGSSAPGESVDEASTPAASASASPGNFQQALQKFLDDWRKEVPTTPPAIVPTAAQATLPAAELLAPKAPTVANTGLTQPCGCPTPPPPCPGKASTTPPAAAQVVVPSPSQPLEPPSGLQAATATPEPSTILSALAMIGAVAWRRRGRSEA